MRRLQYVDVPTCACLFGCERDTSCSTCPTRQGRYSTWGHISSLPPSRGVYMVDMRLVYRRRRIFVVRPRLSRCTRGAPACRCKALTCASVLRGEAPTGTDVARTSTANTPRGGRRMFAPIRFTFCGVRERVPSWLVLIRARQRRRTKRTEVLKRALLV